MDKPKNNLLDFITLREVVAAAAVDTYADFSMVERLYNHWAARGIQKLTNETFKTGRRFGLFTINKQFNSAVIDCDFKEELFVGYIDPITGERVEIHKNHRIVNTEFLETIPCDVECEAKCECCFSKQLCNDLQQTVTINSIDINGTFYDETQTSILQPDGSYYLITETPFFNTISNTIEYKTKKEIKAVLALDVCGCIKKTPANTAILKDCCYNAYCTHCSPLCNTVCYEGGYKIFPETSTIKLDSNFTFDKVYMEWRGSIPKRNGQYIVPAVAKETLVEWIKFKSIQNKKGVPEFTVRSWFNSYVRERENMDKTRGKMRLHDILYALTKTPTFDYHI